MTETVNLELPLLASGQAQKHLTLNEALTKIDHLFMLSVSSRFLSSPPLEPSDGARFIVPVGATGTWSGQDMSIGIFVNGGWDFVFPKNGWRAFVGEEDVDVVFSSGVWRAIAASPAPTGIVQTLEFDHLLGPDRSHLTQAVIPAGTLVFGVTSRVKEAIGGVSGWDLGTLEYPTRYGSGFSVAAGAEAGGASGSPMAYHADTPLYISPQGEYFSSGRIRFMIHYIKLVVPT